MTMRNLNGTDWSAMVLTGAERLSHNAELINALNVFPVPDGDTGTNMNLTMSAGVAELKNKPSEEIGRAAEVLSKGLLMGARGNSGVILSQLFRGFARAVAGQRELGVSGFAAALQQGVDTAYKAVVKPVEGTILTVAREAARHGLAISRKTEDLIEWMTEVHAKAAETLARTPDMLPVLKQVGVVDSGGQGLVFLYEGFVQYLTVAWPGNAGTSAYPAFASSAAPFAAQAPVAPATAAATAAAASAPPSRAAAQSKLATESIRFPYDMEFFIRRPSANAPFPEAAFRKALERDGDSIILIADDDIVKVHVHSRRPGDVLNAALTYGELTNFHILNMQDQHRDLLRPETESGKPAASIYAEEPEALGIEAASGIPPLTEAFAGEASAPPAEEAHPLAHEMAPFGVVAVSVGEGNAELFRSLGVDVIISGGQSMNPSTEDLMQAIQSLAAEHIFVLPNNPNILLAAKQAQELAERPVTVVPTRSIPQGMAAMLVFQEEQTAAFNEDRMGKAIERVLSGSVTQAVRDTVMDGVEIRGGQHIGILDKKIVAAADSVVEATRALLSQMMSSGEETVMVLGGADANETDTQDVLAWLAERYPDAEVESHAGGQPLYPYLILVEQ
ncbi:DAK2 domain-containing protein [Cohnella nanjingensis]|uniref:DAK2 domain-containing protein n=1 Tax=Cohnella nanjingensis TaxID=1387779 RepID=A0A7X0VK95_9BACL|nr:DAK2 domain-containing protein [Cohnella nanjingensis]MBB6675519.1 DAK2 domain-containing protein [Cohnella nanjingensis]